MSYGELTPMFPMHVKPVRKGVYMLKPHRHLLPVLYSNWTGKHWALTASTASEASTQQLKSDDCYSGGVVGWYGLLGGSV